MKTAILKLETLHLYPHLAEDFDQEIERLVADCAKRPGLSKARRLDLRIEIAPHKQDPDDVTISCAVGTKQPARVLDSVRGRRTRKGQLQFDFLEPGEEEKIDQ